MAFAEDYVDVAERIRLLLAQYPNACITTTTPVVINIAGHDFIEVTAHIDCKDESGRQSQDSAWEPFPGKTPYTRDSEMMNASTSAVGRAIGLLGIGLKKSVASSNEVRNRQQDRSSAPSSAGPQPATEAQLDAIKRIAAQKGIAIAESTLKEMTKSEASGMIDELKAAPNVK